MPKYRYWLLLYSPRHLMIDFDFIISAQAEGEWIREL